MGFIEIRAIRDGKVRQRFVADAQYATDAAVDADLTKHDVYYGVLPRIREEGTGDAIVNVSAVLWADLDAKGYTDAKAGAYMALARVSPEPQIVVDSGNGFHAYWLLDQEYPWERVQQVMRGMSLATGADRTYDKARILRVPGTHNYKQDPPLPVRLLRFNLMGQRQRLDDFVDFEDRALTEDAKTQAQARRRALTPQERLTMAELPVWLQELIVNGPVVDEHGHIDRSAQDFKVVVRLLESGWTDEMVEDLFTTYPEGIGQKYTEKGRRGPAYMDYTLRAAHKRIEMGGDGYGSPVEPH